MVKKREKADESLLKGRDTPPEHLRGRAPVETSRNQEEEVILESARLKEAIVASAPDCIITIDREGKIIEFNPAAERIFGYVRSEVLGKEMADLIIPPPLRDRYRRGLAHLLETGEGPLLNKRTEMTAIRADGTEFPVEVMVTRIPMDGSSCFTGYVRDITRRKQIEEERARLLIQERHARAEAEEAQQRLAFLAEASSLLASSLDYSTTLTRLARLAVPRIADWCAIDIVEEDGSIRRLKVAHADPTKEALMWELQRRPPKRDSQHPVSEALQTGQARLFPEVPDSLLQAVAEDSEHLRIFRELNIRSLMIVPLLARGRVLGAITLSAESGRRYDSKDLALAEDLARRAALAVDNARLYGAAQREIGERERREEEVRKLSRVVEQTDDSVVITDKEGVIVYVNPGFEEKTGYSQQEALGKTPRIVKSGQQDDRFYEHMWETILRGEVFRGVLINKKKNGECYYEEKTITPLKDSHGRVTHFVSTGKDITDRKRIEEAVRKRERQQAAVAELGQLALAGAGLSTLMDQAVSLVARTLEVEYAKVLELLPDGKALLLRAGVGWKEGVVGQAAVDAGRQSQAGYTLLSDGPVIVEDLRTETRFSGPPLLHDHGVVSGLSIVIQGRERPFGVFGAHTVRKRIFTQDDVHFIQAIANILATAIERSRIEEELERVHAALVERERLKAISTLSMTYAHYIFNAMTPVKSYAELISKGVDRSDPKWRWAQAILEGIEEVVRLVRKLQEIERYDTKELGGMKLLDMERIKKGEA
jgi:PAS domain S-box-containing protein